MSMGVKGLGHSLVPNVSCAGGRRPVAQLTQIQMAFLRLLTLMAYSMIYPRKPWPKSPGPFVIGSKH